MARFFPFGGASFRRYVAVRRFLKLKLRLFLFKLHNFRALRLDLCTQLLNRRSLLQDGISKFQSMGNKTHVYLIRREWRALYALRRVDCRRRRTATLMQFEQDKQWKKLQTLTLLSHRRSHASNYDWFASQLEAGECENHI